MLSKCYTINTMCYTHLSLHCKIAMLPINYPGTQSSRTDYKREYIAFFFFVFYHVVFMLTKKIDNIIV